MKSKFGGLKNQDNKSKPENIRQEYKWVLTYAFVLMLITTVPYLVGYIMQGDDWIFTGFVFGVDDGNAFIAKMLSGSVGEWLYRTPYTAYPQEGFLIYIPYILLGKLVQPSFAHEKLITIYHLFRFSAGLLAILATYDFLAYFLSNFRWRIFGMIVVSLGGGLGWFLILFNTDKMMGSIPLEFYSPESFGFLSLYIYPSYSLARAFFLWGIVSYLKTSKKVSPNPSIMKEGLKVGVLWLFTAFAQPITGMVVGAIVGIYLFILSIWQLILSINGRETNWRRLWRMIKIAFWAGIPTAPFILYNLISIQLDPLLNMWIRRSYFGSPHLLHYLLAYGLVLPFAILGGIHLWKVKDWTAKFPISWAVFLPALAYAPVGIQRRLPDGIWVALIVLAVYALEVTKNTSLSKSGVVLLFSLPSTILLLVGGMLVALHPAEPIYRPTEEVEALQYFSDHKIRESVVLSSYESENVIPAWAPVYVVAGLVSESINLESLTPRIESFYQKDTSSIERKNLIADLNIDYVFWGPHERELGDWDPNTAAFLVPVYHKGDYTIFTVNK